MPEIEPNKGDQQLSIEIPSDLMEKENEKKEIDVSIDLNEDKKKDFEGDEKIKLRQFNTENSPNKKEYIIQNLNSAVNAPENNLLYTNYIIKEPKINYPDFNLSGKNPEINIKSPKIDLKDPNIGSKINDLKGTIPIQDINIPNIGMPSKDYKKRGININSYNLNLKGCIPGTKAKTPKIGISKGKENLNKYIVYFTGVIPGTKEIRKDFCLSGIIPSYKRNINLNRNYKMAQRNVKIPTRVDKLDLDNIDSNNMKSSLQPIREINEEKFEIIYYKNKIGDKIRLFGSNFVNKNKDKCILEINYKKRELIEFYEIEEMKNKFLNVNLILIKKIEDLSYMFYGCSYLISFNLNPCVKSSFIKNMSYMFYNCKSLKSLPNISEYMNNATDISFMFAGCSSLTSLHNISKWKLNNITNISNLFSECSSLKSIPDISKWNTYKINDMSYLFYGCSSLETLPDISNWELKNVVNMKGLFSFMSSLNYLPDISNWDTTNVRNMSYMFYGCSNLQYLPDISKWNTENTTNLSYMFCNCSSLKSISNIDKWNTSNVTNMSYMFYGCSNIINLPNISKWDVSKVKYLSYMFYGCSALKNIPNFSEKADNSNEKIKLKGLIRNQILDFFPQIEIKFNSVNLSDSENILFLKNEIKNLLKNNNFSIIEIKKGSLTIILCLQYLILREIRNLDNTNYETLDNISFVEINEEIEKLSEELKKHEFASLGTVKPDYVSKNVIDITQDYNKQKLKNMIEKSRYDKDNKNNFYESAKNITKEDLEEFFQNLSITADEQEYINMKRLIGRLDEFNKVFDKTIELALKNSVFEYKIIHIILVEKESSAFNIAKTKCKNRVDKLLFHGTKISWAINILSSEFENANVEHQIGKGVYMTDSLDYVSYYAHDEENLGREKYKNVEKIPKVGRSFNFVVSQVFYDKNKFEDAYDNKDMNKTVNLNGIRCAHDRYDTKVLTELELKDYNKFYGREYVISHPEQILPLYTVSVKRVEYLVVWRDYNFNFNNPNNYDQGMFKEIQEFHIKIKKFITRELNSKIYYIQNDEEAMKLIDRKKYNKVIIITNGNNNGKEFIDNSRRIIGSEAIAAVSAYDVSRHIQWVKNMNNVLILNGIDFHEKFFKCIINNDINLIHQLKNEIIDKYKAIYDFNLNVNTQDLFNFPNFKNSGRFRELTFNYKL